MTDRAVADLASAVADGQRIDWLAAGAHLENDDDRALAAQLETLSALAVPVTSPDDQDPRPLPLILGLAMALAIGASIAGLCGFLLTFALSMNHRTVIHVLAIALFGGAGAWLIAFGFRDRRALALSGAYWSVAASFAAAGIATLSPLVCSVGGMAWAFRLRPEAFIGAFLWQFAIDFPAVTRFGRMDAWCRTGAIVATVAAGALFLIALTRPWMPSAWQPLFLMFERSYDGDGRWFWLVVFATTLPALGGIALRAKSATDRDRPRVRLFLFSIVLAIAPVAVQVMAEAVFPAYARLMWPPGGPPWGEVIVYPPLFIFPCLTAYVVLANDVLDVDVAAKRAFRYVLARWILAWGTAIPAAVLVAVVYVHRSQPVTSVLATGQAQALVWMAALGAGLLALRQPLLRALDRSMLSGLVDPALALADLGDGLRRSRTPMEVTSAVAHAIERVLQVETETHLVTNGQSLVRTGAASRPPQPSLLPVLAKGVGGPFVVESRRRHSYYTLVTDADRRWIQDEGISAFCPIVAEQSGALDAMIVLKRRRNAMALSKAEVQFLQAACGAATLAYGVPAKADPAGHGDSVDELALHCDRCALVTAWTVDHGPCACGGRLSRGALPKIVGGRFELARVLGSGGMGVAYLASDLLLRRSVALKTLPALSADAASRLLDEARAMAELSHVNIAILYGAERWRGTPLLVVEYLEGGTLAQRLTGVPKPAAAALHTVQTLAGALEHMHARGRYHGDIKPSNIGFTADGVPKFLDFGLSHNLHRDAREHAPALAGTLAYLSPEVVTGERSPDPMLDLWALSVVLFELVTGRHPFLDGMRTATRIKAGLCDVGDRPPAAESVETLLIGLLAQSRAARPATATELVERLGDARSRLQASNRVDMS